MQGDPQRLNASRGRPFGRDGIGLLAPFSEQQAAGY